VPCPVGRSTAACTLNYGQPLGLSLTFGTQVRVGINATIPAKMIVTMYWGDPSTPSFVLLPLSGYSSVGQVQILDWAGNAAVSFNLNATKGQNTVLVQAPVTSAFGKDDVRSVNLTIVDSSGRPVPGAMNIPFSQIPLTPGGQQTYPYVAEWTYPSNLPEGNYQVWIDIVDVQANVAFSLHGPFGFGLFKPGIHPLDLVPYVLGAAGGVIAGTFYIRRRRRKEYLAPFDHFYTLTGGSVPQGTMVMVEGNTGAGKTLLTEQLMCDDLKEGRPCVFVSTAEFPAKIRSGMRSLGLETEAYESKEALKFVDAYSAEAGQPSQEKFYVSSSGDLTSLGVKITSAMSTPGGGASVYFDSLTPLAPRSKSESIVSFAQTVGAKVRGSGGKVFFTVGSSLDELILRQLEEASDCIIQMEAFEEGGQRRRRMRIIKFRNRRFHEGWVTFTVEDNKGIIFYSKKPRT
jgi:archaeal flagellar protein FlaH